MQPLDVRAKLGAEHFLQRHFVGRNHMYVESASAQRGSGFETDEARSDDGGALRVLRGRNDPVTIVERTEIEHVRKIGAGHGELDRGRPSAEKQAIVSAHLSARESNASRARADRGRLRRRQQLDVVLLVEVGASQRQPFLLRRPRQVVL